MADRHLYSSGGGAGVKYSFMMIDHVVILISSTKVHLIGVDGWLRDWDLAIQRGFLHFLFPGTLRRILLGATCRHGSDDDKFTGEEK